MIRLLLLLASLVGVASATSDLPPLYDAWTDGSAIDHSPDEANRVRYYFSRSTALPERPTLETLTLRTLLHRVHSYAVDRQVQAHNRRRRYRSSRQNVPDVFRG